MTYWTPKVRDYLTGDGLHAQKDTADPPNVDFLHGDLIGSTMLRTDDSGEPVSGVSGITYTAFGEPVVFNGSTWQIGGALPEGYPRYAYAGQFGYESDLLTVQGTDEALAPVTLAHVGWRWYQPGIGRFVQRDPVGLAGGLNCYLYCGANPLEFVDPLGAKWWREWWTGAGDDVDGGGWGGALVNLTGGYHSWLDSRHVETVAKVAAVVGYASTGAAVSCVLIGVDPWLAALQIHGPHAAVHTYYHLQAIVRRVGTVGRLRVPPHVGKWLVGHFGKTIF